MTVLEARGLRKSVRLPTGEELALLRGADLDVQAGEAVAVVGRSGSGKSTLLAALGLLTRTDGGQLTLGGREVSTLGDRARAGLRNLALGFVFQSYSLVAHLTAEENVGLPLLQGSGVRRAERRRRVAQAMELADIGHRARSRPRQLSGGEQQRVAIARALVRSPSLVLADEPTGALDTATAAQVLDALVHAAARDGSALLLVTHDPAVAAKADRVLELDAGLLRPKV